MPPTLRPRPRRAAQGAPTRRDILGDTVARPQETRTPLPYIDQWARRQTPRRGAFCSSVKLFKNYTKYVTERVSKPEVTKLLTERRFYRQMPDKARDMGFEKATAGGIRGYALEPPAEEQEGPKTRASLLSAGVADDAPVAGPSNEPNWVAVPPNVVNIGKNEEGVEMGYGAFAGGDYGSGQIVAEYLGQQINKDEYKARDAAYANEGICQKIVQITPNVYIDGNVSCNGHRFLPSENPGAMLNHSLKDPNCKLKRHPHRHHALIIETIQPVARGLELRWNYNDQRPGVEEWLNQ